MVTIGAKQNLTGQSGAKGDQMETKREEKGQWGPNVKKTEPNGAKWGQIGPNSQIGQTEPNWVKWGQTRQKRTKQGQKGPIGIK